MNYYSLDGNVKALRYVSGCGNEEGYKYLEI